MRLIIDLPEDIYKKIVDRIVTVSDVDIICQAILDHEGEEKERPRGEWEWKSPTPKTIMTPHCSNCGHMNDFLMETNFCPNCGADMRQKEGETIEKANTNG